MATAYQNIAKSALMNWNGLSEEEANKKIQIESVQELEGQVGAMNSVENAVIGIAKQLHLTEEEATKFFEAVVNGPEDAEIFKIVTEKTKGFTEEQQLGVLTTIHDGWVVNNSSEKTFKKKADRHQLRQYAPLELIGWNEVKSDLLFLTPILASVGVQVDEEKLKGAYHKQVSNYMEEMQINSEEELTELVKQGRNYYPILPQDLETRLLPMSEEISRELIQNWNEKDKEAAQMFTNRQQQIINSGPKL